MSHRFLEIATTPAVRSAQSENGSRHSYARLEGGAAHQDGLGSSETRFIAARDSFYLASVSETGWPYVQHRGGPAGFLKVLDAHRLGFADYRGNRQYLTLGNASVDPRVALLLMDYPNRRRLKLLGRLDRVDFGEDAALAAHLLDAGYPAKVERGFIVSVEAFDWNCPQHITPRFSEAELEPMLAPVRQRLAEIEAENKELRATLAARGR